MQSRIGIDLGGSHFCVGVFGENAQLLTVRSFAHPADKSVPSMARAIAAAARECLGDAGQEEKDVAFCGIGMPSCIHPVTQRLVHSNNLRWIDCEIYPDFHAALPWELRIENDANCAAIGEAKLGAGYKNMLLTLGTGVGGGVILDGRLYTCADRMGAELGHVKLVHQGRKCTCGQLGCLESYASATAFVAVAKEELPSHPDSLLQHLPMSDESIFDAAARGDAALHVCRWADRHSAHRTCRTGQSRGRGGRGVSDRIHFFMRKSFDKKAILDSLKGGLIVSCQVQHDDPVYSEDFVLKMAKAAEWAGAVGIRANSPEQIKLVKEQVDLPMIGLYKIWHEDTDVFITPTLEAAKQVWDAGAEIIALDCTNQITHEGRPAWELLPIVKKEIPEALIFADVSNYEEAARAVELGADIVGPTLYGYTEETKHITASDLREFARMCRDLGDKAFMIMEGHIYTPEDAIKCLYLGEDAVVVGSAITRPHLITKRFADLIGGLQDDWRVAERSKH